LSGPRGRPPFSTAGEHAHEVHHRLATKCARRVFRSVLLARVEEESSITVARRIPLIAPYIVELRPSIPEDGSFYDKESEPELDPEEVVMRGVLSCSVCTAEYEDLHSRHVQDNNLTILSATSSPPSIIRRTFSLGKLRPSYRHTWRCHPPMRRHRGLLVLMLSKAPPTLHPCK
jgi:hypothetical protein